MLRIQGGNPKKGKTLAAQLNCRDGSCEGKDKAVMYSSPCITSDTDETWRGVQDCHQATKIHPRLNSFAGDKC